MEIFSGFHTLGELWRNDRLANNLSQKDVARALGTGQNRISEYENNHRTPSIRTIERYIHYYNLHHHHYFYDSLYRKAYKQAKYNKQNKLDSYKFKGVRKA